MSQHDYNIANQGFPATRADLNNALAALASTSSGTSAPTTTYANQFWYDTTNNLLMFRNEDNDAWITFAHLDQATDEWEIRTAVIQAVDNAGITFKTNEGTARVTIDDAGLVGINNASPTERLDVAGTGRFLKTINTANVILETTDTDANAGPVLDLYRNPNQAGVDDDLIGSIEFNGLNDASEKTQFATIFSTIGDASDGTEDGSLKIRTMLAGTVRDRISMDRLETVINNGSHDLDFRVEGDSNVNMIFVNAANDSLGIGSSSTIGGTAPRMYVHNDSTGVAIETYRNTSTETSAIQSWNSDVGGSQTKTAEVEANGDFENVNNSYTGLSDQRLKQDIVDATSQWDDVKALQVRKYRFINHVETMGDDATVQLGVIAQELEASGMNGLVKTKPVDEADPNGPDRKSVNYSVLYMKSVKALQEAMARIETLETKVAALEG